MWIANRQGPSMNTLTIAFAIILIVAGCLFWLTPVPGGVPAMAVGFALLICSSERAANRILNWRINSARFNKAFTWIEDISPTRLADTLRRTRP